MRRRIDSHPVAMSWHGEFISLRSIHLILDNSATIVIGTADEPTVLKTVDSHLGKMVARELQDHGVEVVNDVRVERMEREGKQLCVFGSHGFQKTVDTVLVAAGV